MSILATAVIAATILFADPPPPCCSSPTSLVDPSRPTAPPTPTADYDLRSMRGWTVRVNPAIATEDPALLAATLEELDHQLYMITRVIPEARAGPPQGHRDLG